MKIIVTGAAGAIGSHLCERLLSMNNEVVGIDAMTPYYSPRIKEINAADVRKCGGKIHVLDIASDNIDHILEGAEIVFHLAAQPGISATTSFEDYLQNNIVATYKILEAAKKISNLKAFIYASTSSVYGKEAKGNETSEVKPASFYGVTKLAAEQLAMSYFRENKLPTIALRFFSVYGERERPEKLFHRLIKAISENKKFPLYENAKSHTRSFTYIRDIIDGCMLIMENLDLAIGEIFNLGSDQICTTGEGITTIEDIMGKTADFIILPNRAGDQKDTAADISKMRKTFGYKPSFSLREGLENEVKWYKEKISEIKNL